jgi:Mlc titration factor MtfA (ptsG expression regulator)
MPMALAAGVALLVVAWLLAQPILARRRRDALRARPFPPEWDAILARRVPQFRALPADLQAQLRANIQVFIGEKPFYGCDGIEITDEMRVTIAAQACLLILNRRSDFFPNLREILVYPGAFIVDRVRAEPSGVLQEHRHVLSGESWSRGQVILSWQDTLDGAAVADDGRNVVIHEFAHQLDQEKGYANGAPWLGTRKRYGRWSEVLAREFARLQYEAAWQLPSLFNYYGASAPAEFFAVATEVFFEQGQRMALEHPELYAELRDLYHVNPQHWEDGAAS